MRDRTFQDGFSLVEVIMVIAVIGVMTILGLSSYKEQMVRVYQLEARSHLRSIGAAVAACRKASRNQDAKDCTFGEVYDAKIVVAYPESDPSFREASEQVLKRFGVNAPMEKLRYRYGCNKLTQNVCFAMSRVPILQGCTSGDALSINFDNYSVAHAIANSTGRGVSEGAVDLYTFLKEQGSPTDNFVALSQTNNVSSVCSREVGASPKP